MFADIAFVLIILINALAGFRRGLFNVLGRLAVTFISLILTLLMLSPFVGWLADRPLLQPLAERISSPVLEPLQSAGDLGSALDSLALHPAVELLLSEKMPERETDFTQAYPAFSAALFRFALAAAFFVLFFAILTLLIHFLTRSLTRISDRVPLLGLTNRISGLAAGLAFGLIQVIVLILLLSFLAPAIPAVRYFLAESRLVTLVYATGFFSRVF